PRVASCRGKLPLFVQIESCPWQLREGERKEEVEAMGLEPTTYGLQSRRSSQLSYAPTARWDGTHPEAERERDWATGAQVATLAVAVPSKTAAFTPRRASSLRNGAGSSSKSASPPAPCRRRRPSAAHVAATAATAPPATAGRSIAPSTRTSSVGPRRPRTST